MNGSGIFSFKARKLLNETLRKVIEERRREDRHDEYEDEDEHGGKKITSRRGRGGLLEVLMGAHTSGKGHGVQQQLSDAQIADNIIGVIFAAHDTTASALTWALKYLHDNPDVLLAVMVIIIYNNADQQGVGVVNLPSTNLEEMHRPYDYFFFLLK